MMDEPMSRVDDVAKPKSLVKRANDLRVYKLAFDVSLALHHTTLTFPKIEQYGLADQMRRASKSICANLAEGFAKQPKSPLEFKRYLSISIGSAAEMLVWIEYAQTLGYIPSQQATVWADQYDHILKMLQKLKN